MKHKKRTYRKEQPKETLVVWDILKNETVAFLDTEYVTTQQKHGRPAKLVSVGMVICRGDFEEVDRFHSYIHMDGELHDKFRELTGITEKDLKYAPSYEKVMEQVGKKLDEHEVEHIFVWGPDKIVIQRDLVEYREMISKKSRKIVNRILRMMKDIEAIYSRKLKLRSIGIANLKYLCGLGNEVCHDALSDASDLKNVIRHMDTNGCPKYMVEAMRSYLADKELYCRCRRFHEKWDNVPESLLKKSQDVMQELEHMESMEAKALRDDMLAVCTGEDLSFPTLEEYILAGTEAGI